LNTTIHELQTRLEHILTKANKHVKINKVIHTYDTTIAIKENKILNMYSFKTVI